MMDGGSRRGAAAGGRSRSKSKDRRREKNRNPELEKAGMVASTGAERKQPKPKPGDVKPQMDGYRWGLVHWTFTAQRSRSVASVRAEVWRVAGCCGFAEAARCKFSEPSDSAGCTATARS
ncbi:hypothetical protein LIA77_07125 [Sarocladium implicatum]|nr:hypothetical protein LIA77_07125 [Sarocladium implicatum]